MSDTASTAHLLGRLRVIDARVRRAVQRRREADPGADDRFRGLYISETEVDGLMAGAGRRGPPAPDLEAAADLARVEAEADAAEAAGADLRLRRLARSFGLDAFDVELLLIALAPDVDPRFERLYAYLHDNVSRRRASTGLALELCGAPVASGERRRLGPLGALCRHRLVAVEEPEHPFLTRSLRVPDRVTGHLLGDDTPDPHVHAVDADYTAVALGDVDLLARAIRLGARLVYLREPLGGAGLSLATAALAQLAMPAVALDLTRLGPDGDVEELMGRAAREAGLGDGAVVAGPVEALAGRDVAAVRAVAEAQARVVVIGSSGWDPRWSRETPLILEAPVPAPRETEALWRRALGSEVVVPPSQFRLSPEQIGRAATAARLQAGAAGRALHVEDLRAGARAQNAAGLERLARRIEPRVAWPDLVLPPHVAAQLSELVARVRQRHRVLDDWGMAGGSSKGHGVKALFAGDSGTGKTISAEVVAGALGLDLYVIDLATVVDKYIGETEKNLDRIFAEADRVNGVLLFDEADALFGKRSDVKDAHDRYANVEVAYLLQRMELFEGLAILTTNLRSNLDEAFARRLDAIVDFPMPEEDDRARLWERHLSPGVPRSGDIDVAFLARAFRLSGGNISNVAMAAAYMAADADRAVTMADLIRATEREYRKLGHLCLESEFGPYHHLVATPARG